MHNYKHYLKSKKFWALIIAIILIMAIFYFADYYVFKIINNYRESLLCFVCDYYLLSAILYIFIFSIMGTLLIPGVSMLAIASGFLFDSMPGSLYSTIGGTLGAAGSFFIIKKLVNLNNYDRYKAILYNLNTRFRKSRFEKSSFKKYEFVYLIMLRVAPIIPYSLVNLFGGLVLISFNKYILSTALGSFPRFLFYAMSADQLVAIKNTGDFMSYTALVFILLIGLSIAPLLYTFIKK